MKSHSCPGFDYNYLPCGLFLLAVIAPTTCVFCHLHQQGHVCRLQSTNNYITSVYIIMYIVCDATGPVLVNITSTVVGVYRDWPGCSASNLYI